MVKHQTIVCHVERSYWKLFPEADFKTVKRKCDLINLANDFLRLQQKFYYRRLRKLEFNFSNVIKRKPIINERLTIIQKLLQWYHYILSTGSSNKHCVKYWNFA